MATPTSMARDLDLEDEDASRSLLPPLGLGQGGGGRGRRQWRPAMDAAATACARMEGKGVMVVE
uniref:Uncharacterized protein n=1 Tax=Oryza barthii TaxID=65489 RepID=A0A0D3FRU8_9ORYZ